MTDIIDGNAVAEDVRAEVSDAVDELGDAGVTPTLATVLMSTDPASETYVSMKQNDCEEVGIDTVDVEIDSDAPAEELYDTIDDLNADDDVDGILVQMPVPDHVDDKRVLRSIDYGETSQIVTLFTQEKGKLGVMAKGARRPKSSFGATLQPMAYTQVVFYHKPSRTLQTLSESSHVQSFHRLREKLPTITVGLRIVELVDALMEEEDPQPAAFALVVRALHRLNIAEARVSNLWPYVQLQLAQILGVAPAVDRTRVEAVTGDEGLLSLADGGVYPADGTPDQPKRASRAALRACDASPELELGDRDWRVVAGAAHGPGMYGIDPAPFWQLAVRHLVAGDADLLSADEERLLVGKLLQARPWDGLADLLGYHSTSQAMRALGDALRPLVAEYGTEAARDELRRFED